MNNIYEEEHRENCLKDVCDYCGQVESLIEMFFCESCGAVVCNECNSTGNEDSCGRCDIEEDL